MPHHPHNLKSAMNREEQAREEIGRTEISRPLAVFLVVFFILLTGSGWLVLFPAADVRSTLAAPFSGLEAAMPGASLLPFNRDLVARLRRFDEALDEHHPAAAALRPPVLAALATLGAGDRQVLVGRDGWLYYDPDVTALTGPGIPDDQKREQVPQVEAILSFHRELAEHGIRLVLLPVPVKPSIHPEPLSGEARFLRVRGFERWKSYLESRGVAVLDLASALQEIRNGPAPAYLKSDTHWTPSAMDAAATVLAGHLRDRVPDAGSAGIIQESVSRVVSNSGDTAQMLALPADHPLKEPETVRIQPVAGAVDRDAPVVLLGDSFSNIYSLEGMGWGSGAGLAERLAFHLGRPVRPFVRNDAGAWGSRQRFLQAIAQGDVALARVRVVVWQFSERELAHGDWRVMPLPAARHSSPATQAKRLRVQGRLAAVSDGPRKDAPYADFLVKWHVVDLRGPDGQPVAGLPEAVVSTFGMKGRAILPAAALRPGAFVTLDLQPWADVESRYGTLNAGGLEDPSIELDLPLYWGEPP